MWRQCRNTASTPERLRNEGAISDDVLRELQQELDLDAVRVGRA